MFILNSTPVTYDGKGRSLEYNSLKYIILHRIDLETKTEANPNPIKNDDLNGVELVERFKNTGLGTGGRCPYHAILRRDLVVEQLLPLNMRGAHTIGHNRDSIGFAVVGDFRREALASTAWLTLIEAIASLTPINGGLEIAGHTSLPGASADPNKKCPGKYLDPWQVSSDVIYRLPKGWLGWSREMAENHALSFGWRLT